MKKQLLLIIILVFIRLNVNAQTQLIANGNFSSSSGWTTSGNWYISSAYSCYNGSPGYAYAGDSGGNPVINEYGNLKQTVTIPSTASSATLSFFTSQNTQETVAISYDYIEVYFWDVNNNPLKTFVHISNLNATSYPGCQTYGYYSYDVSAYKGQTIQVVFHVYSDGGPKNTLFRVDDVSLTYIGGCSTPSNPANPTSNSPQAGSVTITRSGSPSSGITWYWQGTSCGTSTSLGSGTTYTATSSGTYYIRAYNNTGGCWSTDCGSVNVSVTTACTAPSAPGNPTSNSPQAGSVTITRAGSPPSGVTWYWQGTSCGTSTSLGSGTTYTATSSGNYYIRAYNNTGGCWSTNCGSVNVSVTTTCTTPTTPGNPTSNSPQTSSVTITRTGSPPSGVTWYWQGTSCGTSTSLGSGSTYIATSSGTYYIKAYNNTGGCWSTDCGSVNVTISSSTSVSGIDVHAEKGVINWPQVYSTANKTFAFVKATKGVCYIDSKFSYNMDNGKSAGVVVGAYHFALPEDNSAIAEADYFYNAAHSYIGPGYLPPALDIENPAGTCIVKTKPLTSYYTDMSTLAKWVNDWATRIHTLTNIWPVIYADRCNAAGPLYPYYQNGTINANIKLWIADYSHAAGSPGNYSGCNWVGWPWVFHQYSDAGTVAGLSGQAVDLDVFNGDITAFNSLVGGTPPNPPLCNNDNPCSPKALSINTSGSCVNTNCSTVNATPPSPDISFEGGTSCATPYVPTRYDDDVWFSITPTTSSPITIKVTPTSNISNFDVSIGLYQGSCSNPTQVGCATAVGKGEAENLSFTPVANTAYLIRVFSYDSGSSYSGNFDICATTTTTSPDIDVTPSSITINQSGASSGNSPSYALFDNSKNNPINNEIKDQVKLTDHLMGCIIPDSIVEYWKTNISSVKSSVIPAVALSTAIDWSINDSPVKDQGVCGSCWAFAATAFIENIGNQSNLSEQVVISCSGAGTCSTGYFDQALKFFKSTGVPAESCYPYTGSNGNCSNMCSTPDFKEKITAVSNTLWGLATVENLKTYLQEGPLIVRMLVPTDNTFDGYPGYLGGVYDYNGNSISSETRGHAVLLVGYDDNKQCFKAKNSWGSGWGENGYFRISYDDVTDDVQFGSYAITGSGVYTQNLSSNSFTIANIGNGNLSINSITDNKNWLTTSGYPSTPFNISKDGSQPLNVSIDWSSIGSSSQTGIVTIASNDPDEPSVTVQVTAVPISTPTPTITISSASLPDFGNIQINTTSSPLSYTVSGSNLTANIALSAPDGFQISKSSGSGFGTLLSLTPSGGIVTNTTIYARFNPSGTGFQSGNISLTSTGATPMYVSVSGTGTAAPIPTITVSLASLPDFGNIPVGTTSSPLSYTVSGSNLTANIALSAPDGFQISKSSGSGFGTVLTLTSSGGTVTNTTIYARFSPSGTGFQSGHISITSTGATTKYVSVSGTAAAAPTPVITASTTGLTDFGSVQVGANSSPQNYTVSGNSLTANIILSAPGGFQISTSSNSGFGSSLTLTQSGGTVPNTTIYARFSPASIGFQSGNISITSTGATTKYVSVSGTAAAAPTPLSAPLANSATSITQTGFTANWNASSTATGYRLDISLDNAFTNYLAGYQNKDVGNVLTLPVTGLVANTSYYYRVKAYNSGVPSDFSNTINATTLSGSAHFTSAWTGNGFDQMNINIYSAKLNGVDLVAGDEIGIFDGTICVGTGILANVLTSANRLNIIVSRNDGSGNGYTSGNPILFKLYDSSSGVEVPNVAATYSTDIATWSSDGKFAIGSTAFAALSSGSNANQNIAINTGWNIISSYLIPTNLDLKALLQPLIDAGKLKKVMDESGKTIENFGAFGGWQNNIGNLTSTEGYKVNVTAASTLSVQGTPVPLPLSISLNSGWNIISYPSESSQDAKALVQSLIDTGNLKKVMDESGKTIENLGAFGGWQNNIGNFLPGKGYKVNVTTNCALTIPSTSTKAAILVPEVLASAHFSKVFIGNGTDHMSVNLVNLQSSELHAGDEIGIFDGQLCVGSVTIGSDQITNGKISIPASSNDELSEKVNGFISGHPVELQLCRGGHIYRLTSTLLSGNGLFEKNGSMIAQVNTNEMTGIQIKAVPVLFKCFPNPFTQEITIEVRNSTKTEVTVEIYNIAGQHIKTLYKGSNDSYLVLKWNGKTDSGQLVTPGVYLCKVNDLSKQVIFKGGTRAK